MSAASTSAATALHVRGGGFMSHALEEQVLLLDRQLRQARDEMAKLRKQLTTQTAIPSSKMFNQERNLLKQQLASLKSQINQLERMKLDLEDMLQKESDC
jgi:hypothetical protein